jgi:hypothetical protein
MKNFNGELYIYGDIGAVYYDYDKYTYYPYDSWKNNTSSRTSFGNYNSRNEAYEALLEYNSMVGKFLFTLGKTKGKRI